MAGLRNADSAFPHSFSLLPLLILSLCCFFYFAVAHGLILARDSSKLPPLGGHLQGSPALAPPSRLILIQTAPLEAGLARHALLFTIDFRPRLRRGVTTVGKFLEVTQTDEPVIDEFEVNTRRAAFTENVIWMREELLHSKLSSNQNLAVD